MGTRDIAQSCYIINKGQQFIPGLKLLKQPGDSHVLRNKTAEVLLLLLQTPGQVVYTKTFFDVVWRGKFVSENVLKQSISELRHCLCDEHKKIIVTLPKTGYLLQCHVEITHPENVDGVRDELPQPSTISSSFKSVANTSPQATAAIAEENSPSIKASFLHNTTIKLRSLTATFIFIAIGLFLENFLQAQQTAVTEMQNKNAELDAGLTLYKELHRVSVQNVQHTHKEVKSLLDEKLLELLDSQSLDFAYLGQLDALKDLYVREGYFDEALLLAGRLEHGVEMQYGQHSEKLIRTKLETVKILLQLQRSEEAFSLGNRLLVEVQEYYSDNQKLLLDVSYHVSRTNLLCVDSFCQREG